MGKDLVDSKALIYVLNRLDNSKCSLNALEEGDELERANIMIGNAEALGVPPLLSGAELLKANVKINTIFVSYLFNINHGLDELNEEMKEAYDAAALLTDDIEGSRDERAFRFWINSLAIEDVYVTNLYEECADGLLLLKVIHKINDQMVNWKSVEKNPNNKFKMGINCG